MKNIRRMQIVLLFLIVFNFLTSSIAQATDLEIVKIGVIFPLTGAMATFGEDMARVLPV